MPLIYILGLVIVIGLVAYTVGRQRAASQIATGVKQHSRVHYHGWWAFILSTAPAILFLIVWSIGSSVYVERQIETMLPAESEAGFASRSLELSLVHSLANGLRRLDAAQLENLPSSFAELQPMLAAKGVALAPDTKDYMIPIAVEANATADTVNLIGAIVTLAISIAGAAFGVSQVAARGRARNKVESVVLWALLGSSMIAIVTTIGIVLSMLFETFHFFSRVPAWSFFFGTVWDPRFAGAGAGGAEGQFGLIPLLAGTLYIALVALLVAVPVGLMSAVYMSEYASKRVRGIVKPALELLAGIPTIVYGIFALVTLGPFQRDLSAALAGGSPFIQGQSIFTAGFVMGIMLIPVVSSL
ncbi:MAG: PstC family ABC transporter permease, partial [Rhizobiaceae bacterium]